MTSVKQDKNCLSDAVVVLRGVRLPLDPPSLQIWLAQLQPVQVISKAAPNDRLSYDEIPGRLIAVLVSRRKRMGMNFVL